MDIGSGLSSGTVAPETAGFAPLPGYLSASNIVVLGASIMSSAYGASGTPHAAQQAFAAAMGFTGVLRSYAASGDTVSGTLAKAATAKADLAASQGGNLYLIHSGGNNVTTARPYPGGAGAFAADYDTLVANLSVGGDKVLPLPLTKRLYSTAPLVIQGDAASEANGSKPYNDAIILPKIGAMAPDWLDATGKAHVDPYTHIDENPDIVGSDGTHGPGASLARFITARIAARAAGCRIGRSRAGKALLWRFKSGEPNTAAVGPVNEITAYVTFQNNPVFPGAICTDGSKDYFIEARIGAYQAGSNAGPGVAGYARLADTRLHDSQIVTNSIYVQGAQVMPVTFTHLTPGDRVAVTAAGLRKTGGTSRIGRLTLTGGQVRDLNCAQDVASNQVVFDPVTVPPDGRIVLSLAVAPGASYGYLSAILLDFA
jgi:hypothetical protein